VAAGSAAPHAEQDRRRIGRLGGSAGSADRLAGPARLAKAARLAGPARQEVARGASGACATL